MFSGQRKREKRKPRLLSSYWYYYLFVVVVIWLVGINRASAQGNNLSDRLSPESLWMLIAACLVFFMNAGFAMLEAGFCRQKNAINVLAKNLLVFCVSALAFWIVGFGLMFGDSNNGLIGLQGFFFELEFTGRDNFLFFPPGFELLKQEWFNHSFPSLFFFQLVFAGTAATIISGAVAERIKFIAFILFTFLLVGFLYPLTGHWVWSSNGWLKNSWFNFQDFAGSTIVHSVGGMAALVGARLLGPRAGKYDRQSKANFSPDSLSLSTLGCFILWLGWFGFNGGSVQRLENLPHAIVTTMMAAAAGGFAILCWSGLFDKPSLASVINGILGGLVAITASSVFVDLRGAFVIGAISGLVVILGGFILELSKTDDPVGAVPVHLFCGLWGTVAVGIFSVPSASEYVYRYTPLQQTFNQLLGWLIVCGVIGILSWLSWIGIGIFLYYINPQYYRYHLSPQDYLNPPTEQKQGTLIVRPKQERNVGFNIGKLGKFLLKQIEIGRKGIRVSPQDEQKGSDGFFQNL